MLVLARKLQEKIHIGDNITITVVRIDGNVVRVGIDAPPDVRIMRAEVLAKQAASAVTLELLPGESLQETAPIDSASAAAPTASQLPGIRPHGGSLRPRPSRGRRLHPAPVHAV